MLTFDDFRSAVGERFELVDEDGAAGLTLIEATASPTPAAAVERPAPFSLLFLDGSARHPAQGVVRLRQQAIGETDIFLVPVERRTDGVVYQAVFS